MSDLTTFDSLDWDWIASHLRSDVMRLRLADTDKRHSSEIDQIERRRRAAGKLPDALACPRFVFPTDISVEQCTSESLADFHASLIWEGSTVVDLTSGLGIDAMHLARKASSVTAIDINPVVTEALKHNLRALAIDNVTARCCDGIEFIASQESSSFDYVFIDPSRRTDDGSRVYDLAGCSPDVVRHLPVLMAAARKAVIIKASPMFDISRTLSLLPCVSRIYCVGTPTECRELLIMCEHGRVSSDARIIAVTISGDSVSQIEGSLEECAVSADDYEGPREGWYLYRPYPAVMKSGLYRLFCKRYGLAAISHDSHLYLSSAPVEGVPADEYRIEAVIPFGKQGVREVARRWPMINVATRGFPISAPALAAKLRIKEGGDMQLFGVKNHIDAKHTLIICSPK